MSSYAVTAIGGCIGLMSLVFGTPFFDHASWWCGEWRERGATRWT